MGILTEDMRRVLEEQQLGFVATVCADGTPNLSPKATTLAWDDDQLIFADICSPGTVENLRRNPAVEINVVDALTRTGYRFKGVAAVHGEGPVYEASLAFYRARGSTSAKRHIVLVKVEQASALISPAYDQGQTEAQVTGRWRAYWQALWARRDGAG